MEGRLDCVQCSDRCVFWLNVRVGLPLLALPDVWIEKNGLSNTIFFIVLRKLAVYPITSRSEVFCLQFRI